MSATNVFPPERARVAATEFDLAHLPADFHANPYRYYHALRDHCPVKAMPDGSWFLTRYDDILPVYRDPKRFSSDKKLEFGPKYGPTPLFEHHTTSLVFNDPPLHTRVRRAIVGALSQRHIAAMEPGLVTLVDRLLDDLEGNDDVDLIDGFAGAVPVQIIGNLLGVPHQDRGPLRGWSLAILGALEPVVSPERAAAGNRAVTEFLAYLRELVADRRNRPGDPAADVLTRLIQGETGEPPLSEIELLHQCVFLLNAGHETTTNLIGNAAHALTEWPGERARLVAQPALIESAVEEFLRFESSNQLGNRITTCPVAIGATELPAHARITLCIGAANRDPQQFPDPDRLDLGRTPNRHVAFGFGIHTCAGLNLARLEGRIAIGALLARFPDYALAGTPVRGGRARFRGFAHLPVKLAP
ncbi:MAG: cytochrome P450 [Casimicrobiaceae bacterium]